METVPFFFCDEVAGQLSQKDNEHLQRLSRSWGVAGREHYGCRISGSFQLEAGRSDGKLLPVIEVNVQNGKIAVYSLEEASQRFTSKYFRIHIVLCSQVYGTTSCTCDSKADFPKFVKFVASHLSDSPEINLLNIPKIGDEELDIVETTLGLLKASRSFSAIWLLNYGKAAEDFVVHQTSLPNLRKLVLIGPNWRRSMAPSLCNFLKSPSFEQLEARCFPFDTSMFKIFFERYEKGEFDKDQVYFFRLLTSDSGFDPGELEDFRMDIRTAFKNKEWPINYHPNISMFRWKSENSKFSLELRGGGSEVVVKLV
ncbi:hypothetical protein QR680_013803 [Steinernema hermaphroditum]|uniref:Uncharacterized protein n=1 Tax=Steinernema hermaphroditum TaxID=289476 RepID=A0AA39I914_9BILA|nr:hypothetical protein QR680_013803 [Steinernema hermaphroditum]